MPKVVDADERRHVLAAAAARVIAASGIAATTLRDVAAEAGLTTGSLTHYFSDKHELLIFTLQASLEHRRAAHPRADTGDVVADLRSLLEGVLPISDVARLHWIVSIAFAAEAAADDELAAVQRRAYRHFLESATDLVARARATRRIAVAGDPATTAQLLIALADGVALQALFDEESWPVDRQRSQLAAGFDALLRPTDRG